MIPFLCPSPPGLDSLRNEFAEIQNSGIFTNNGPLNARFETALQDSMFGDGGACVTTCNATIALILAIRAVVDRADAARKGRKPRGKRFALMPSFTFAAAALAAEWAGLEPLFCDVDPDDWFASEMAEEEAIRRYGDRIAVIVPYATFGESLDLARYEALSERTGIPVVVDAAASLGSLDASGHQFGSFSAIPVVFSMHATKTFATGEGGVIHSADRDLCQTLRTMSNFGFGAPRSATMPGLNAKLTEVGAALALKRLEGFETIVRSRQLLALRYRFALPELEFQRCSGIRVAHQFMPVLLPRAAVGRRDQIREELQSRGVGAASYFSPHVAEQPHFRRSRLKPDLPVTQSLSDRILSLPLWDGMSEATVDTVCAALKSVLAPVLVPANAMRAVPIDLLPAVGVAQGENLRPGVRLAS
ncbi:DegT/DnrJ/EryC1/StrS family aminotransferase [Acetobacteraceae bacterium KSS8]|uniref:DegT/DnrJ/EryC1/StrS family aminotransferase n=1 Tax=Endosaccharibacter trunci TaxID=2812733 RepID=A0ABT1WA05_9PROT|nr:DegT/DnrJ/EryC1/StrS family aminotransferase [Acetobacteraceae bacterium KSS8]